MSNLSKRQVRQRSWRRRRTNEALAALSDVELAYRVQEAVKMKKTIVILLIALGAALLSSACIGDGTHVVGRDIQPGTYQNSDSSGGCYWERLRGFSGTFEEIIANDFTTATAIVTIDPSDVGFKSNDCGVWTQIETPPTAVPTHTPTPFVFPTMQPFPTFPPYPTQPPMPTRTPPPAPTATSCCVTCTIWGQACGDSCISRSYACYQLPGCACNSDATTPS